MTGLREVEEDDRETSVTWRTLGGILVAAVMLIVGWAWTSTATQVVELSRQSQLRGERLAIVETDARNVKEQLQYVQSQLREVDQKLDELLSRHK